MTNRVVETIRIVITCGALAGCEGAGARGSCADDVETLAAGDGCKTIMFTVGDEGGCTYIGDSGEVLQENEGEWLRLVHPADRATRLVLRMVSSPVECTVDGPDCPYARLTTGGANACECRSGQLDNLPLPVTETFEWPLQGGTEQQVLLSPVGAVFEVSICTSEEEPFPVCALDPEHPEDMPVCPGNLGRAGNTEYCACFPPCAADSDCPIPRTGTVTPRCDDGSCILPCGPSAVCPDGFACISEPPFSAEEPACMAPY